MFVVVSRLDWHRRTENSEIYRKYPIIELNNPDLIQYSHFKTLGAKKIFFLHWSDYIQPEVFENFECIVFHASRLPFDRGGSPIQNQILKGIDVTDICAIKVTEKLDEGPVYMRAQVNLHGSLNDIFECIGYKVNEMIAQLINSDIKPINQTGAASYNKRLTADAGELKNIDDLKFIYDKIRMLDGYDYPRAYIRYGDKMLYFTDAFYNKEKDSIECKVTIKVQNA